MPAPEMTSAYTAGLKASGTIPVPSTDPSTVTADGDRGNLEFGAPPVIAGFRVVRRLGGGGMGDVYEVVDERLDLRFALKTIRPDRVGASFRERFRQEMRAMMPLRHPNVARIYKHDEVDGRPYFTMEYAPNGTVADRKNIYKGDPRCCARLIAKVADAVDYLHRQGKVHRDLKPSNILIDAHEEPLVSDFGLVKDVADLDSNVPLGPGLSGSTPPTAQEETRTLPTRVDPGGVTRTGGVIGTVAYMSPEQARGDRGAIGRAADVWALGVILYELVVGYRPADAPDQNDPLTDLTRIDPKLSAIVDRCLAPEPVGRYGTAAALAADLRHWADPPAVRPTRGHARRRIFLAIGLLGVASGAVILAVQPWVRNREKPQPTVEQLRQDMRDRLAAGEAVTLIDAEGNAAPVFRLVAGDLVSKAGRHPEGWWGLHSPDVALAEFLDDPGVAAFTLTAEVRGEFTDGLPKAAGLIVSHRKVADPTGMWDFQVEFGFREQGSNFRFGDGGAPIPPGPPPVLVPPPGGVGPAFDRFVRLHGAEYNAAFSSPYSVYRRPIARDQPTVGGPWLRLEIRRDGDAFDAYWEGNLEYSVPALPAEAVIGVQNSLKGQPDPPISFSARGGLGLYVQSGSASFRNVKIRPGTTP